ncbi:thymidine kinase [Patescibacteria group bacterium]|nr:thymidine kinase [Patescibacteria group bacterium]
MFFRGSKGEIIKDFKMFGPRVYKSSPFMEQKGFSLVITGPMGSGKTTELFRQLERIEIAGGTVMLIKPVRDDRDTGVRTHGGFEREAIALNSPEEIFDYLEPEITTIGIEEAQFFDDSICGVVRVLVAHGKRVILSGLDLDAMGRPFGPMPFLLTQAEYVMKLQAVCMSCGADASRTKRKVESKEQVMVGGMEIYEPVCTACHESWLRGEREGEL